MSPLVVADVERFRDAIVRRLGLRFDDGKVGDLAEMMRRRCEVTGHTGSGYLGLLDSGAGAAELRALATELTVTETYFFRNAEQLRALVEVALPALGRARPLRRPLRVLSAGCATGEEPYSVAILARESLEPGGLPIAIQALDINPAALERARRGRYSRWALRDTPEDTQSRYFRVDGRELVLDEGVRARVVFEERNLVADDQLFWRRDAFDVVFCRNVLMYLSPARAREVVTRISESLVDGGYVFLGYAETMRGLSQEFHLRHTHGTFYYQRREEPTLLPSDARPRKEGVTTPETEASQRPRRVEASALGGDLSWIETIRAASERIATLESRRGLATELLREATLAAQAQFDLSSIVELIGRERFEEAHDALTHLPPESASDPDVLLMRAVLLTHGKDLAAAEALCARALALDEMSAGAHYVTALCREAAGDHEAAGEHDRVATYLDASFAMPRLHLGLLARRAGDRHSAARELGEALSLLEREDASRLLLYGGGFGRTGLVALCRAELRACGGTE